MRLFGRGDSTTSDRRYAKAGCDDAGRSGPPNRLRRTRHCWFDYLGFLLIAYCLLLRREAPLPLHDPHHPARGNRAQYEQAEAVRAVANHVARVRSLCDPKDDGSKESEDESGAEVRKLH